jgi:enterochelin esterase-like enzyme
MHTRRLAAAILILGGTCLGAPLANSQPADAAQPAAMAGTYERITVHGPSLVGNLEGDNPDRNVSVYLPPSYAKKRNARYPVLYLLHGFTSSDSDWFGLHSRRWIYLPAAVDRAFAAGAMEMIIVMPDAYTRYLGSMYSNSATIGDWESFISKDLVSYIDQHYRTIARRDARGLAGHSMGGYGTLRIGMKYPQVFSSLYAMNPCCLGAHLEPNVEAIERAAKITTAEEIAAADFFTKAMLASGAAWSPNPRNPPHYFDLPVADGKPVPAVIAAWAANAPLAMVHQYVSNLRQIDAIAFDAADKDLGDIPETVRTLDEILKGYDIAHETEIYEGDHVNRVEERVEKKVLPFFSKHLKN